jgi:hypothetical protein
MANVNVGNYAGNQAESVHAGINAAICHISLSASWSSGDVHRIGKLPNGAIPLDSVFYPGAASPVGLVAKFGTSASQEAFFASATYSVMARTSRRLAVAAQISLSDDAVVQYEPVVMVATAGCSIGHVGDLVVFYKMPGQAL